MGTDIHHSCMYSPYFYFDEVIIFKVVSDSHEYALPTNKSGYFKHVCMYYNIQIYNAEIVRK